MGFIHNEMRQLKRQCVWNFFPYFLFTSLTDTFLLPHKIDREKKSNVRVKIQGCFIIRLPMGGLAKLPCLESAVILYSIVRCRHR